MANKEKKDVAEIREQLEKVLERSKEVLHRGRDEVVRLSQVARLRLEILNSERQGSNLYEKLGRSLYTSCKKKDFPAQKLGKPVTQLLTEVEKLEAEIQKARQEIRRIEKGVEAKTPGKKAPAAKPKAKKKKRAELQPGLTRLLG